MEIIVQHRSKERRQSPDLCALTYFNNCRIWGGGLPSKINLSPRQVASPAVCSKAVILLLFILCLMLLPLFVGVLY